MVNIVIQKSSKKFKKYDAIIDGRKTVAFGDNRYEDYTMHKDPDRKERYITRHRKTENWNNYETPGFYSRWILWNLPTIESSVRDANRRFPNITIKLK